MYDFIAKIGFELGFRKKVGSARLNAMHREAVRFKYEDCDFRIFKQIIDLRCGRIKKPGEILFGKERLIKSDYRQATLELGCEFAVRGDHIVAENIDLPGLTTTNLVQRVNQHTNTFASNRIQVKLP